MKIVITDGQTVAKDDSIFNCFNQFGEVNVYNNLPYNEIADAVQDADIVLCNKSLLNRETLEKAKNLKYIGLFATGYNNIDTAYCKNSGITVCNAGSYSSNAVAQHTFALILSHYSKAAAYNSFVKDGMWQSSPTFSPLVFDIYELAGKTIGIIGYGKIGKAVAKIAKAFQMNVLCYSRTTNGNEYAVRTDLDTLLNLSDIISVHCPLNKESLSMFNYTTFNKMKDGAFFVNTARGAIVVEQDLYNALETGKLSGAGIDVLNIEPMAENCPLIRAKNIIITPHVAWSPVETRTRLMGIVRDNIINYLQGTPVNVVV